MEIKLFVSFIQPGVHLNRGSFHYRMWRENGCFIWDSLKIYLLTHYIGQALLKLVILQGWTSEKDLLWYHGTSAWILGMIGIILNERMLTVNTGVLCFTCILCRSSHAMPCLFFTASFAISLAPNRLSVGNRCYFNNFYLLHMTHRPATTQHCLPSHGYDHSSLTFLPVS